MEGILSNVHKFHTVYSSWHYVESCKILMNLFFSIRTDDMPNFGPIVYIYFSPHWREACSLAYWKEHKLCEPTNI